MKILVVQDADWLKKGPHQQHHLMERLSVEGHEIVVVGFDQLWAQENGLISKRKVFKNIARFYADAKIKYIRSSLIKLPFLDYLSFFINSRSDIKETIDNFKPDVVIGFTSILSCFWGVYYSNKNNIPFIYYWTDVIHELIPFKPFKSLGILLEKYIMKRSSAIFTINEILYDKVLQLGADQSKTDIIPGGIDFNRFNPSKFNSKGVRSKYNFSDKDFILFFMGWLYPFSGLKEIIYEMSKFKIQNPFLKLLIVGNGDAYSELKKIIDDLDMHDRVIMTGYVPYDDIPGLISIADICLIPAHNNKIMRDIVPIKIYEYLAMHKTVISTNLPGVIKEFGNDSGVVYVKKPEDVINQVKRIKKSDLESNRLKAKVFIKNYSWDKILLNFKDEVNRIILRD